jgi:hypothetical protein
VQYEYGAFRAPEMSLLSAFFGPACRSCYTANNSQYPNGVFFQSAIFQLCLYFNGRLFQRSYIFMPDERGKIAEYCIINAHYNQCLFSLRDLTTKYEANACLFACLVLPNACRRSVRTLFYSNHNIHGLGLK